MHREPADGPLGAAGRHPVRGDAGSSARSVALRRDRAAQCDVRGRRIATQPDLDNRGDDRPALLGPGPHPAVPRTAGGVDAQRAAATARVLGMTIPVPDSLIQITFFLGALTFMYVSAQVRQRRRIPDTVLRPAHRRPAAHVTHRSAATGTADAPRAAAHGRPTRGACTSGS